MRRWRWWSSWTVPSPARTPNRKRLRRRLEKTRDNLGAALHPAVIEPFLALREAAVREGIELAIFSGFRDFEAQCRIWNLKYRGERPCYDARGNVRDCAGLGAEELADAILAW